MEKLELLRKYANMAQHNVFCYSRNLGMTEPKEGFERQWKQAKEECELLDELMKEVTQEVPVLGQLSGKTNGFYGQIGIPSDTPYEPWDENALSEMHMRMQKTQSAKNRKIIREVMKSIPRPTYTSESLSGRSR